jgi:hypothetical protein
MAKSPVEMVDVVFLEAIGKGGYKARRASKGSSSKPDAPARVLLQSPTRQQGNLARVFKARRASKGCFLLGCEETLACASGFEENQPLLARRALKDTLACA